MLYPIVSYAQKQEKTVRVGWYESPFNMMDAHGRRSGYAYEYQKKIASYTNWTYEYVEGSWPELLQMLIDGDIDLMSDVSYTPERAEQMLFSSLAMGTEEYYIFTAQNNKEIRRDNPQTLDEKRIGVNKGSIQVAMYRDWAAQYDVKAELIELTEGEAASMQWIQDGTLDAYLTLDAYGGQYDSVPLFKVGSSDFFFAVNKERPDLLADLNTAMNRIHSENRYYTQQLSLKYISASGTSMFLEQDELNWLFERKNVIRVGYQDDFLAFCASDEVGELTGALKDYLAQATACVKNTQLVFDPVAYPTSGAAMDALRNREVDCIFPSNLGTSDGESLGFIMTPAVMSSDIYAVVRSSDRDSFSKKEEVTTAIKENDPNSAALVLDHFPNWQVESYPDIRACFKSVADGKADCVLISNYQYNTLSRLMDQYNLVALATGRSTDFCFAINQGDYELYSILTRTTNLVSDTNVNAALNYYSSTEITMTLADFIRNYLTLVIAVALVFLALIVIIIFQHRFIVLKKRVEESKQQVENLSKQIYVDALTSLKNKGGYDDYIKQLQTRIDQGETLNMAIVVFDCDNLKEINDRYGHDKGNLYLQESGNLICRVFQHSAVFRTGGDEFAIVLMGEDYENRDALMRRLEEEQIAIKGSAQNEWDKVSISSGIAVYEPLLDFSLKELARRADQLMYENKRARKESQK